MDVYGISALIILVLDIWAIVSVLTSGVSPGSKIVWVLLILALPLVGMLLWFLIGPRSVAA